MIHPFLFDLLVRSMKSVKRTQRGFTLIELLIVIAIMVVIVAISVALTKAALS